MNIDYSNIGVYSRMYGALLDNPEYLKIYSLVKMAYAFYFAECCIDKINYLTGEKK